MTPSTGLEVGADELLGLADSSERWPAEVASSEIGRSATGERSRGKKLLRFVGDEAGTEREGDARESGGCAGLGGAGNAAGEGLGASGEAVVSRTPVALAETRASDRADVLS